MSERKCFAAIAALFIAVALCTAARAETKALLLFGAHDHKTFLGCLNCGRFSASSVCNKFGEYGSRFNQESIWNRFGNFGSRFSDESPWNRFGNQPPVIVDNDGNFYGYLTANRSNPKRTRIAPLVALTDLADEITSGSDSVADKFCGRD